MNETSRRIRIARLLLKLLLLSVTAILCMTLLSAAAAGLLMPLRETARSLFYGVAAILTVLLTGLLTGRLAAALMPVRGLAAGALSAMGAFLLMLLAGSFLNQGTLFSLWTLSEGLILLFGCLTGSLIGASKR